MSDGKFDILTMWLWLSTLSEFFCCFLTASIAGRSVLKVKEALFMFILSVEQKLIQILMQILQSLF